MTLRRLHGRSRPRRVIRHDSTAARVAAMFGAPPAPPDPSARAGATASSLLDRCGPGMVIFVTGPSGSGKSLVLRHLAHLARARTRDMSSLPGFSIINMEQLRLGSLRRRYQRDPRSVSSLFTGSAEQALSTLARAGLAEASTLGARVALLSDGQRFRLSLALAMNRARHAPRASTPLVIADEFASTLDRSTAEIVCVLAQRWARRTGAALVVATAHIDIAPWLDPDVIVHVPAGFSQGAPEVVMAKPAGGWKRRPR